MPQGALIPVGLVGTQAIDPRETVLGRDDARPLQDLGVAAGLIFLEANVVVTGHPCVALAQPPDAHEHLVVRLHPAGQVQTLGQVLKGRLQADGETPLDAPLLGLAAGGMANQAHLPADLVDHALGADLRVARRADQDGRLGIAARAAR
jgi:hypothetical protein